MGRAPHTFSLPALPALPWLWIGTGLYLLVMAIISFGFWRIGGYGVETDAFSSFLPEARDLLHGRLTPLDGFKGPGYHLAVAAVGLVVRNLFWAGKIVSLASAAAVLLILTRLVWAHLGRWVALLVFLIVATNAQFVLYTIQVGTDMYFLALTVMTAALVLDRPDASRRRSMRRAALAGLLAGLAYLTRYNGLFLILGGTVVLLLADWREIPEYSETEHRRPLPWRVRVGRTATFLAASAIVIVPWSLFTWSQSRGFFYNLNYLNIAYEMYGRDRVAWDQFWEFLRPAFGSFGDVLGGHAADFVRMVLRNMVAHVWLDWRHLLVAGDAPWAAPVAVLWGVMTVFGLVATLWRWRLHAWPALFLGLATYGMLVPVFYGERFSLPMLPIYATLAAIAVAEIVRRATLISLLRYAPAVVLILLLWAGASVTVAATGDLLGTSPEEIGLIVGQSKGHVIAGERVLARKPHVAWYLGLDLVRMPIIQSLDDLPQIARQTHARYLFVSVIEAGLRQPLIPLLDPANAPRYLRPIAATQGHPAVLYEFTITIPPKPAQRPQAKSAKESTTPLPVQLGRGYLAAGRFDLARQQFTDVLRRNPNEPTALLGMVELDLASQMSALSSTRQPTEEMRTRAYRAMEDATEKTAELAGRFPQSREVQLAWGDILVRQGQYEAAILPYRQAAVLDSTDPIVIGGLGDLQRAVGDLAGAEKSYRRLLELLPGDPEVHRALGQVLASEDRLPEALEQLGRAFAIDSTSIETEAALARALSATGDTAQARIRWRAILRKTTPDDPLNGEAAGQLGIGRSIPGGATSGRP